MISRTIKESLGSVVPQTIRARTLSGADLYLKIDWNDSVVEEFLCELSLRDNRGHKLQCIVSRDALIAALSTKPLVHKNTVNSVIEVKSV